ASRVAIPPPAHRSGPTVPTASMVRSRLSSSKRSMGSRSIAGSKTRTFSLFAGKSPSAVSFRRSISVGRHPRASGNSSTTRFHRGSAVHPASKHAGSQHAANNDTQATSTPRWTGIRYDPTSSVLSPIRAFGRYLLDEEIARGGMSRVFAARLRGVGGFEKRLVVKQIRPELARDPRFVSMLVDEANTLVQMSHPHIAPVFELGVVDGVYFLAMEYVDGATLAQVLESGPLAPGLAAHL